MYQQDETIARITEATGSAAIHSVCFAKRASNPTVTAESAIQRYGARVNGSPSNDCDELPSTSKPTHSAFLTTLNGAEVPDRNALDESTIKKLFRSWSDTLQAAGLSSQ